MSITGIYSLSDEINKAESGLSTSAVDISIQEYNQNNEIFLENGKRVMPGDEITLIPRINNLGIDCYIRAKITYTIDQETIITSDYIEGNYTSWTNKDDYYYYDSILEKGKSIDLFDKVKIPNLDIDYQGKVIVGFTAPDKQTITIDPNHTTIVTYRYTRNKYTLTVTNTDYVSPTSTASGTYYYESEIHLVADSEDIDGFPFVKWTDDTYNRNYTFMLIDDMTIGPVYDDPYIVTFEPNNGDAQTTKPVIKTETVGTLPSIKYDDCVGETGDYDTRQCTYFYKFEGWYKESTFETKVDETFVPTENITLYAKWRKVFYSHDESKVFDGTNYLDTGVKLFSEENVHKNFELTFEITDINGTQTSQATIVNAMLEKSPYPGFVFRFQTDTSKVEFNSPKIAGKSNINASTTNKVVIKRVNDVYFLQLNGGTDQRIGTYSGSTFDETTVIGASIDGNGSPMRFFKETLDNISIIITDAEEYTVHFDANGGTGTMENMIIMKDKSIALTANTLEREGKIFDGWNTKAEGSGTDYANQETITNLTNAGETINLYAVWADGFHYNVRFNANGGTGTMSNQEHIYATSQNLSTNTFTRDGYIFCGWNTEADGSGTFYKDNQSIKNLTKTENAIVDLYAVWAKEEYEYNGEYVFDGSNYIDTDMYLFSEGTIDKDFDISFEIISRNTTTSQATMMSAMDESGEPWPGVVYRVQSNTQDNIAANVTKSVKADRKLRNNINKVLIKRRNGILYMSFNDGADEQLLDMTTLSTPFDSPVTFGCSLDGVGNPQRYFTGTLKDMHVKLYE